MSIRGYIEIRMEKEKICDEYSVIFNKRYHKPIFKIGDEFFNCLESLGLLVEYTNDDCLGEIEICPEDLEELEKNEPEKYEALYIQYKDEMKRIDEAIDNDMYGTCSITCL